MGRTKRKRLRKSAYSNSIDCDPKIVALKKWMKHHDWTDDKKLKLKVFETTGRGVSSCENIKKGDTLIKIPWNLMVTISTLENSGLNTVLCFGAKLKMQEALSIFFILEKNHLDKSFWKPYIDSLPEKPPPSLWLCSKKEIDRLPEELKLLAGKRRVDFLDSWESVKKSINPSRRCYYCNHCVLDIDSFTWAYSMVNTRAVYVDPTLPVFDPCTKTNKDLRSHLSDEPRMALCPFLDMFNHSFRAETEVTVEEVDDLWTYQINSLTKQKKHEQIFISYGSHDNFKLLLEYGFFVPGNKFDCVKFTLEEILAVLKVNFVDKSTYKFLKSRNFDENLYVSSDGESFNLKALLYVVFNENKPKEWCECIFSEKYTQGDLQNIAGSALVLLRHKYENSQKISEELLSFDDVSENFRIVVDFWKYWTDFVENLCQLYKCAK